MHLETKRNGELYAYINRIDVHFTEKNRAVNDM